MAQKRYRSINTRYRELTAMPTPAREYLEEIADAACVTIFAARDWATGKRIPDASKLKLLSEHFGQPADTLFDKPKAKKS